MKQCEETNKGKQTATRYRRSRLEHGATIALRVILLLATVLFVWITDLGCAFGWIRNAKAGENWPADFVGYGQMMIAAVVFLTVAVVLVFLHRNWISMGVGAVGMTLCMIALVRVSAYASDSGFYSRLMDMPADALYQMEILPTWVAYGCLVALALLQYFSFDAKTARRTKKRQEEAKAPSILENTGN